VAELGERKSLIRIDGSSHAKRNVTKRAARAGKVSRKEGVSLKKPQKRRVEGVKRAVGEP